MFENLIVTIEQIRDFSISLERQENLKPLIEYIQHKINNQEKVNLNFICTHNSRRSHLSQIWAQTFSYYFGINGVNCYSAGTEATALFPEVINVLESSGFVINKLSEGSNPVYSIKYADNAHPIIGFSKELKHNFNPKSNFGAIMTCDAAYEACPIVNGADQKFAITFEDPKQFDNTEIQKEKYIERSMQIASEFYYVFSQINNR